MWCVFLAVLSPKMNLLFPFFHWKAHMTGVSACCKGSRYTRVAHHIFTHVIWRVPCRAFFLYVCGLAHGWLFSSVARFFFQKSVFPKLLSALCTDFVLIFSLVNIRPLFSVLLLLKVPIVFTNASHKNCIKLTFLQKTQWAHVFISSRRGARGIKDLLILK